MTSVVCVDASLILNVYLPQPLSNKAEVLWRQWQSQGYRFVAPTLFRYEVTTVLRRHVHFGRLTPEKGLNALNEILTSVIEYPVVPDLHTRAYQLATQLGRPRANDAHYLIVAQTLGCEFWTADRKLVNAVSNTLPWVKFLGDYVPS